MTTRMTTHKTATREEWLASRREPFSTQARTN